MRLTGTILRCLARKVNSGGKETYVTNLLVLDPDNSTETNYAVEVWDEEPHDLRLMSPISPTVVGVVKRTAAYRPSAPLSRLGPRLRRFRRRRRLVTGAAAGTVNVGCDKPLKVSRRDAFSHSLTSHPRG
jgi:hypothetical protein